MTEYDRNLVQRTLIITLRREQEEGRNLSTLEVGKDPSQENLHGFSCEYGPVTQVVGGMVGSSPRLLSECKRIAAALEIPSELDETSDALWEAADSQGEGTLKWERYGIESFSCVCLMRACMKSIEAKAGLVFC